MNNYYFTFGQCHVQKDGTPMKDYWVRVRSTSYANARELFICLFSSIYMPAPDKWSFQYEEKDFSPDFFPKGEYFLISPDNCGENKVDVEYILNELGRV